MYSIAIHISESGEDFFATEVGSRQVGKIDISLSGSELILNDTNILAKRYVRSVFKRLLHETVEFTRMHELKIVTVSRFVQKQFSSNPAKYTDVWKKA
jgi:hypothetical protein